MTCAEAGTCDEDDHPMPDDAPSTDQEPEGERRDPEGPASFPPPPAEPQHYPEPYYPPPGQAPPTYPPPGQAPPTYPPPGHAFPYVASHGDPNGHGQATSERPGAATAGGPTDSLGRPLSAWTKRGAAFILDAVIAGLAASMAVVATLSNRITETPGGGASIHLRPGDSFLVSGLFFLSYTAYFTFLTGSRRGQTVGSMALGIAVRDAAGGGQIGAARGLVRSMILSAFCVPVLRIPWLLDMAFPLWTPSRQALHDRAVRSVVVDVR